MSLRQRLVELRNRGEGALIPFITAGDPDLRDLPSIIGMLQDAGADAIEVGIPFSDPIADGPTIQASSQRALDRGVTPGQVLDVLADCDLQVPIIVFGYYNPLLRMGLERFAVRASEAGIAASVISDLTPEESGEWAEQCRKLRLENIFLAAPTSTEDRLAEVCRRSTGFVYAISRMGVTGAGQTAPPEVSELVTRIRKHTDLPVCVGFGISRPEHVRMVCDVADGAVVGSWLVDLLAREWSTPHGPIEIGRQVRDLKRATTQG